MFLVYHFIIGSFVCTRSPAEALKGYEKFQDLCTEHCLLECVKTCSRVFI